MRKDLMAKLARHRPIVAQRYLALELARVSEELDQLCLSAIARFKRPRGYVFLDALPKNNYGKVLKTELRKLHG